MLSSPTSVLDEAKEIKLLHRTKEPSVHLRLALCPHLLSLIFSIIMISILIFIITLLYSVIQPAILIFGALYFGISYVVWKYKLLFGKYLSAFTISPRLTSHCIARVSRSHSTRPPQSSTNPTNPKAKHGPSPSSDACGASSSSSSS